jgi:hypothetical protein
MNAERLHAIAAALKDELAKDDTPALLRQLVDETQAMGGAANPSGHQQNVANLRQQLGSALATARSNEFSPAWRQALDELGVATLVGDALREQVETIFGRNEITPTAAAEELTPLAEQLELLNEALAALRSAFRFFEIGSEDLAAGEFEVGFLVPRTAVKDELAELGGEFIQLKRILGPFLELSTGSRPEVRVRSIASSDFQVLLDSLPATALLLATALERIISSYEKVMNIRLARQQLSDSGASEKTLASITEDADNAMSGDIEELVEELLAEGEDLDPARRNEVRKELRDSLNALANRIDKGYAIEVRSGPPPDEPDEDEEIDPAQQLLRDQADKVIGMQRRITYRKLTGGPIRQLPEETDGPTSA